MNGLLIRCIAFIVCLIGLAQTADAGLLYSASLKNGDYGGGFQVGTGTSWNASGSLGGTLSTLGIIDSPTGVTYTTNNDVINYSLGADGLGGFRQSTFRTTGTVSVYFKANLGLFLGGQPFVDNYGFDQFNSGQATFGTGMGRNLGGDGISGTADDRIGFSWSTWHNGAWYSHTSGGGNLVSLDEWHQVGFTWGGPTNDFEIWIDGVLSSSDNLPGGVPQTWGSNFLGRGSAYNFALGEIHERRLGNGSPRGVMFADLEIWDEYRALGNTVAPVAPIPEPSSLTIFGLGSLMLFGCGWRRKKRKLAA